MCRINVLQCPNCKRFSPIPLLDETRESRQHFTTVYDNECKVFMCFQRANVNKIWAPSSEKDYIKCSSDHCKQDECFLTVIYRDCCSRALSRKHVCVLRWNVRKLISERWGPKLISYVELENKDGGF